MQDVIRLLPDALANQIAAGEVVQRPASVVKELMENSIDAGATEIELIINDAGKSLIQVVDNGKGMSETDARMCFERHATSKISTTEDLFNIRTMGFRGEALASISAVAQVELRSRRADDELGVKIIIEASEYKTQEPFPSEVGTSISVKNLFYNVPARRNFLKSDGIEMKHVIDEFQRIALSYPDKSFKLFQDGKEIYQTTPGKLSQRVVDLLGKSYKEQLVPCEAQSSLMNLKGYVGLPEAAKKTRGDQFIYINNRFIKSHYLNHAIATAYEEMIPEKYSPFYILFIEMDPIHLDINVHPTKTEVKFDDERSIYAIIRSAVKQALGSHNIYPTIDFTSDVNLFDKLEKGEASRSTSQTGAIPSERGGFPQRSGASSSQHWEKLFYESDHARQEFVKPTSTEESDSVSVTFESGMNHSQGAIDRPAGQFILVQNEYIFTPVKSGVMVIDFKAAHERVIYEKLRAHHKGQKGNSQRLLFPVTVTMNASDFALLEDIQNELAVLGFEIEPFGKNSVVIQGIPADIAGENEQSLLEGLLEQYKHHKNDLELSVNEKMVRIMAKRMASNFAKKGGQNGNDELINKLFSCENPNFTPAGRPIFKIIEKGIIDNYFK